MLYPKQILYDISKALHVNVNQLMDIQSEIEIAKEEVVVTEKHLTFFESRRLYFYFYDGRYNRLKDGIIDIFPSEEQPGEYNATLSIHTFSSNRQGIANHYTGKVVYSDMLIRFSFVNQYNKLEEDLLYIFNPLEARDFTEGLLCGISSADLMPCAFKCIVTLTPQEPSEELRKQLLITKKELKRWQKLNMLIVDNRG